MEWRLSAETIYSLELSGAPEKPAYGTLCFHLANPKGCRGVGRMLAHVAGLTELMRLSPDWPFFVEALERAFPLLVSEDETEDDDVREAIEGLGAAVDAEVGAFREGFDADDDVAEVPHLASPEPARAAD